MRNYSILKNADAMFAFGYLDKKTLVKGGTGFSVKLACAKSIPVYLFELNQHKCFRIDSNSVEECDRPSLAEKSAVIGSRKFNLHTHGYTELLALFT